MKRNKKNGFSLLEVIAAVVILAVVAAATVATVAPMRAKSDQKLSEQEVATLNSMAQTYFLETGAFPRSVNDLVTGGYLANTTPAEQTRITAIRRNYTYARATGTFTKR
ncbi:MULTISPECIES: prepilin-type N-terminal cleavage/methylation domain-containing protein [Novipirellula]|uniref:Prepilin-type N-terminal cleavage/methylation domain-containing protein n=1 Tax=Novipirellula rosea TaxID=1031540 RepID=A0ABP8NJU6_9BACT|tara:strand:+ start:5356 stop:5682 length:327 start_codon:yes stop_codon:yes gene_type:complete